jgi:hypothetical protein
METLKMRTATKQELTLLKLISICLILDTYVNCFRMYFGYYNVIPNYKSIDYIDINAFMKWFEKNKIKSSNNITDKTMIPTIRN